MSSIEITWVVLIAGSFLIGGPLCIMWCIGGSIGAAVSGVGAKSKGDIQ